MTLAKNVLESLRTDCKSKGCSHADNPKRKQKKGQEIRVRILRRKIYKKVSMKKLTRKENANYNASKKDPISKGVKTSILNSERTTR